MPPASRHAARRVSAQDRDAGGGRRVLQRHEVAQVCAADPQPLPVRLQAEQLHQDMDQRPHPIDAKRQEAGVADRHVQRALRRQGLQRRIDVGRAGLVLPTVPDIAARIEGTGIEAVQDGDHRAQDWQQVDPLAADLHAEGGDRRPVDVLGVVGLLLSPELVVLAQGDGEKTDHRLTAARLLIHAQHIEQARAHRIRIAVAGIERCRLLHPGQHLADRHGHLGRGRRRERRGSRRAGPGEDGGGNVLAVQAHRALANAADGNRSAVAQEQPDVLTVGRRLRTAHARRHANGTVRAGFAAERGDPPLAVVAFAPFEGPRVEMAAEHGLGDHTGVPLRPPRKRTGSSAAIDA
ncbi:hypothetical protein ACW7BJ_35370 [Azospirillum argentinense]